MSDETRLGLAIMGCAVLLGVIGDALLTELPLGINLLLFVIAFAIVAVSLLIWRSRSRNETTYGALGASLVFAAFIVWRDSKLLAALNVTVIALLFGLAAVHLSYARSYALGLTEYLSALAKTVAAAIIGVFELAIEKINWHEVGERARSRRVISIGRALAIAIPILAIFTALFAHADVAFSNLAGDLVPNDVRGVFADIGMILSVAILSGGVLSAIMRGHPGEASRERGRERLGRLELAIVLGLLDLLFLAFVAVQIRYLFGGKHLIMVRAHLTYAQYAHRGFFELVAVCALVLPLLLVADWLRGNSKRRRDPLFSVLAGILIALLGVIMASAFQRMKIYEQAYGLTELRFYGTAFLIWLAVVFAILLVTVLNGRRHLFSAGALVSALIAVVCLNIANPDAWIARVNIERFHQGKRIDINYLYTLSDDAFQTIQASDLSPESLKTHGLPRRELLGGTEPKAHFSIDCAPDWRTWNLSRSKARNLYCNR